MTRVFPGHGARMSLPMTRPLPAMLFLLRGGNTRVMVSKTHTYIDQ